MGDSFAMTLRLPQDLAEDLKIVADCDGETVSDAIRAAVADWVERRRRDPNMQDTMKARVARMERLLEADHG